MKTGFRFITLLFFSLVACSIARSQADPTAIQPLQISAFGAATGTWTGLDGGRNVGITAGLDVGWRPFYRFYPSIEVRGTYPFSDGTVDAQRNILYGGKIERYYGRFHPYGDFLVGRDKIVYENGGYPNADGSLLFLDSDSNVFSYGGGVDMNLNDQFSLKVDGQFQRYGVPVNSSGHIWSKPISVGVVYHFNFNHHFRYDSNGQVRGYRPPPPPKAAPVPPPASDNATPAPDNSAPAPDNTIPAPDNAAPANPAPVAQPPSSSTPPPQVPDNTNTPPQKPSPDTPAPTSSTPQPQQPQ